MADLRAARRYASALFSVAVRQSALDAIQKDLFELLHLWNENPGIAAAMERPQIPLAAKRRVWQQLLEGHTHPLVYSFVQLLLEKRRIMLLPSVGAEFRRLSDEHRNIVRAQVWTALPMTPGEADALKAGLARRTGKTVELVTYVDPSILGGVILRIGDRIMDGSLRNQLANLKRQLAGARY
jgi:F-type H+-transporting ATPase subunit delta